MLYYEPCSTTVCNIAMLNHVLAIGILLSFDRYEEFEVSHKLLAKFEGNKPTIPMSKSEGKRRLVDSKWCRNFDFQHSGVSAETFVLFSTTPSLLIKYKI